MAKKIKKEMSVRDLAVMGGKATLKKYGAKHFSELGKKRWENERASKKKIRIIKK